MPCMPKSDVGLSQDKPNNPFSVILLLNMPALAIDGTTAV